MYEWGRDVRRDRVLRRMRDLRVIGVLSEGEKNPRQNVRGRSVEYKGQEDYDDGRRRLFYKKYISSLVVGTRGRYIYRVRSLPDHG